MSTLKKKLRWSYTNETTVLNQIVATVWRAHVDKFVLEVTNYPGTRTLMWEIRLPKSTWRVGGAVDRVEHTVATLKDFVYDSLIEMSNDRNGRCQFGGIVNT